MDSTDVELLWRKWRSGRSKRQALVLQLLFDKQQGLRVACEYIDVAGHLQVAFCGSNRHGRAFPARAGVPACGIGSVLSSIPARAAFRRGWLPRCEGDRSEGGTGSGGIPAICQGCRKLFPIAGLCVIFRHGRVSVQAVFRRGRAFLARADGVLAGKNFEEKKEQGLKT